MEKFLSILCILCIQQFCLCCNIMLHFILPYFPYPIWHLPPFLCHIELHLSMASYFELPLPLDYCSNATVWKFNGSSDNYFKSIVYTDIKYPFWFDIFVDRNHSEVPERISRPYDKHCEYGLVDRCYRIPVSCQQLDVWHRCVDLMISKQKLSTWSQAVPRYPARQKY